MSRPRVLPATGTIVFVLLVVLSAFPVHAASTDSKAPRPAPAAAGTARPAPPVGQSAPPAAGSSKADASLLAKADRYYYDDQLTEAVQIYEQLRKAAPEDPILAYKIFFCWDNIPGREKQAAAARDRAQALLERKVSASPDPVSTYYLAVLVADKDPKRARALRQAELARQLPSPQPSLGFFPLYRLAVMAGREERPPADVLTLLRAALRAEGGAWKDSPKVDDLTDLVVDVGKTTGALQELAGAYDSAIRARPKSASLRVARSRVLAAVGRTDAAKEDLDAAIALAPESPRDLADLGAQLIEMRRETEAVPILQKALTKAPLMSRGWQQLAIAHFQARHYEEAVQAFRRDLALEPDDTWARTNLGHALSALGRLDEAEKEYRQALAEKPGSPGARWALGSLLEHRGQLREALAIVDAPGLDGEPDATLLGLRIRLLWQMDRNAEAVSAAEAGLKKWPQDTDLKWLLARALEDRGADGDLSRALEIHRDLARLEANEPTPSGDMARVLWKLKRPDEALKSLAATLKAHPDYVYGWELRGDILFSRDETRAEGVKVLEEAVRTNPDSAELWLALGKARSAAEQHDAAIEALRKAISLEPRSPEAAEALWLAHVRAGKLDESIGVLDEALKRMPKEARLHQLRGVMLNQIGKNTEALASLETAVRLAPDNAMVHHSLAIVQHALKQDERAFASWDRSLALQPGYLAARKARAEALLDVGREKEALAAYRELLRDAPEDPDVVSRGVEILEKLGRPGEAEAILKGAAAKGSGGASWLALGDLRASQKKIDEALEAYAKAAEDAALAEDSLKRRVELLAGADRELEGVQLVEAWIAKGHDDAWSHETLSYLLMELGEYDRARKEAQTAIRLAPDALRPQALLGDIEARSGRKAEAGAAYARAVAIDPSQRGVWIALAETRRDIKDLDGAVEAARSALDLEDGADLRHLLADLEEARGGVREAEKHWRRALELAPENAEVMRLGAAFFARTGKPEKAVALLRDAARVDPKSSAVQRDLGLLLARQGEEAEAVRMLAQAIALDPQDTEVDQALHSLAPRRGDARDLLESLHPKPLAIDLLDAEQALARFDPSNAIYKNQPLAHVLDFLQMEIEPDGSSIQTYHGMVRVLDEKAVESAGEIRIPFDAGRDRLEIHTARTRLPGGRVVDARPDSFHRMSPADTETANLYSDAQIEVISMPAVQVGSTLEWHYTVQSRQPLFDGQWWKLWGFDSVVPNALSRFVLKVPAGRQFSWKALNIDVKPEIREQNGYRIYTWTAANRPAAPREPQAPPLQDIQAQLQISSMKSWEEVGRLYHELSRNRYVADPALTAEITPLLQGTSNPEEKARRLTDFVRSRIRYVGIEFGVGGYQPRAAGEVLRTAYGDCKDQVTLLVTLLRQAGIEAYPALVRTESRRSLSSWTPSPAVFDHAITYLPAIRGGTFVDTTVPGQAFGDLPPHVQGSEALVVRPDGARFVRVPMLPPAVTTVKHTRSIDLTRPKSAAFVDRSEATGLFAQAIHLSYGRLDPQEQAQQVASDVHRDFPAATDLSMDVSGAREPGGHSVVVQTFKVPDLLQPLGKGRHLLSLEDSGDVTGILELSPESTRTQPYVVPVLFTVECRQEVKLPPGWTVESQPQPAQLRTPGGTFSKKVEVVPGGVRVTSRFELTEAEIPVERYAQFAAFVRAVAKNQNWNVVLKEPASR